MPELKWWVLPFVGVMSILATINIALFSLLYIKPEEFLSAQGLYLNICGAMITLVPDIGGFDKLFEPTKRIKRIEAAQDELFLSGSIKPDHEKEGYCELVKILSGKWNVPKPPDRIAAMTGGFGVSANLYFQYEKDEDDIDVEDPNAWQSHNNESIGPTGVLDSRASDYVDNLKSRGHRLGFIMGIIILLTGFVCQFVAIVQ